MAVYLKNNLGFELSSSITSLKDRNVLMDTPCIHMQKVNKLYRIYCII